MVERFLRWTHVQMDWGRSSCASPLLPQAYVGDPQAVEKEGDDGEEISERRQAVVGSEALVEVLHLLRDL